MGSLGERLRLDTHFGGSSTWRESSKAVRGEEASQGVREERGAEGPNLKENEHVYECNEKVFRKVGGKISKLQRDSGKQVLIKLQRLGRNEITDSVKEGKETRPQELLQGSKKFENERK